MAGVVDIEVIATTTARNVIDRSVTVQHQGRTVPAVVLTPEDRPPRGLVLIGHGANGNKRDAVPLYVGRVMAKRHGLAAALIDAPKHGERIVDGELHNAGHTPEFKAMVADPSWNDVMVEDWQAVASAASDIVGVADDAPIGYWGLSMGCHFGMAYVASEPRMRAAVLGLFPGYRRHLRSAAQITCPVLFVVQWHDELFDRGDVLALYDALASHEKKLVANPGPHSAVPRVQFDETVSFLASTLAATQGR